MPSPRGAYVLYEASRRAPRQYSSDLVRKCKCNLHEGGAASRDGFDGNSVRPAIFGHVEKRVGADKGNVGPPTLMNFPSARRSGECSSEAQSLAALHLLRVR
jgi:hypothetical protein